MPQPYCSPSVHHPCPLLSCTRALGVHPMTGSPTTLFLWDTRTLVGISKNNSFLPPGRRFCQQLSKHRFYGVINTARDKLLSRLFKVSLLLSVVWAHRPGKEAALTGRPQAWQRAGARRLHLSGTPLCHQGLYRGGMKVESPLGGAGGGDDHIPTKCSVVSPDTTAVGIKLWGRAGSSRITDCRGCFRPGSQRWS